jgi:hypothetical protein
VTAGVAVAFDGGSELIPALADGASRVIVSVDGANAETHDRIRGRRGSFDRAMNALSMLDEAASVPFGIDFSVMRGNFDQHEEFCTTVASRFPAAPDLLPGSVPIRPCQSDRVRPARTAQRRPGRRVAR